MQLVVKVRDPPKSRDHLIRSTIQFRHRSTGAAQSGHVTCRWVYCGYMTKKDFQNFDFLINVSRNCSEKVVCKTACKTLTFDHTHNIPIGRSRDLIGQLLYSYDEIVFIAWYHRFTAKFILD